MIENRNAEDKKEKIRVTVATVMLVAIFIMLGAGTVAFIYSEDIYALTNSHNVDIEGPSDVFGADYMEYDEHETYNAVVALPPAPIAEPTEPARETAAAVAEHTTERVTAPATEAESLTQAATTESRPPSTTSPSPPPATTEQTTAPPTPTTPAPTEPPPPVQDELTFTEVDYPTQMFASAIQIQIGDKSIIVEPPPLGRDLELQAKIVPVNADIPNPIEYFKDIIFLGDSVTTGFDLYRDHVTFNGEKVLAETTVIAVKSYGILNATRPISDKSLHPLMNGVQTMPEDIIAEKAGSKVFICLGLNDVGWQSPATFFQNYADLINRIRAKSPNKTVAIMSVTPLTEEGQRETLHNARIMEFNKLLIEFAAYNNIPFIDYAAALRDEENHLFEVLSSDNYCHIVPAAYNRLVEYLVYHSID